jgi:hypothetical protein
VKLLRKSNGLKIIGNRNTVIIIQPQRTVYEKYGPPILIFGAPSLASCPVTFTQVHEYSSVQFFHMTGGYSPATPRKNMIPKILAIVNTERITATTLKY